jgi:hypothetical protein
LSESANPLAGAWHLRRWDITYSDGRPPSFPYGPAATGLIQYTSDGTMSACIARAGRGRLSSSSVRSAPAAEQVAAFESYFQYAGPYEMRTIDGHPHVVHHVTHSLNPNFVGTDQIRRVELDGTGGLTLSASDQLPGSGVMRHHRLQWARTLP